MTLYDLAKAAGYTRILIESFADHYEQLLKNSTLPRGYGVVHVGVDSLPGDKHLSLENYWVVHEGSYLIRPVTYVVIRKL